MFATLHIRLVAFLIALAIGVPAVVRESAVRSHWPDAVGLLDAPDRGTHCADGLDPDDLSRFFSQPIGALQGADYQRSVRLPDGRVLWTFQDAFMSGTLVHNVALIQSGRCFELVTESARSWLFPDDTLHMRRWHWILGAGVGVDGATVHLYVVEMREHGETYLSHSVPTRLRRVVLDIGDLSVTAIVDEPLTGVDLYGWSTTADRSYTYLYSHCYRQFGFDGWFGFGECAAEVKVVRVPLGRFGAAREYWNGGGWSPDHRDAVPVIDVDFTGSGNNPAQITFDGTQFLLVEKRDDWLGETVEFGVSETPQGPFRKIGSMPQPLKAQPSLVNTYFASWLPWTGDDGGRAFCISHNMRDGRLTHRNLTVYRPTCHRLPVDVAAAIQG